MRGGPRSAGLANCSSLFLKLARWKEWKIEFRARHPSDDSWNVPDDRHCGGERDRRRDPEEKVADSGLHAIGQQSNWI